jgi:hypothetical protein
MLNCWLVFGQAASAFALHAVGVAVALPRQLGPVPDEETGIAGELVRGLCNVRRRTVVPQNEREPYWDA